VGEMERGRKKAWTYKEWGLQLVSDFITVLGLRIFKEIDGRVGLSFSIHHS